MAGIGKVDLTEEVIGSHYEKAMTKVNQLQNALEQAKGELKYIVQLRNSYAIPKGVEPKNLLSPEPK